MYLKKKDGDGEVKARLNTFKTLNIILSVDISAQVTSDFQQQWCLFNGVYINCEEHLMADTLVFIYITHAAFICPKQPDDFTVH